MIRSARLFAFFFAASLAASATATAQDGAGAVPPVDPPEFAAKPIDQMTADEVLKLVRFSYTLYNRDFKGALRMGITKKVDFLLSLKPEAIRFIFNEPAQVILLDTREQRFALYEGVDGAELKQVPAAKYGEAVRGTDVTYEDLSMRFLYWPGARIIDQEKLKGRDTIRVGLRNPDGAGNYATAEVWIDKLSGGMMKMIGYDRSGRAIRKFEVLSGKKFGDIWMVDEMRIETVTGASGGTVKSSTRMQIQSVAE
jgi:hypothetical protein